jgi:hypothetical protein
MAGKHWSAQPGGQKAVSPTHVAEGQNVSTPAYRAGRRPSLRSPSAQAREDWRSAQDEPVYCRITPDKSPRADGLARPP